MEMQALIWGRENVNIIKPSDGSTQSKGVVRMSQFGRFVQIYEDLWKRHRLFDQEKGMYKCGRK